MTSSAGPFHRLRARIRLGSVVWRTVQPAGGPPTMADCGRLSGRPPWPPMQAARSTPGFRHTALQTAITAGRGSRGESEPSSINSLVSSDFQIYRPPAVAVEEPGSQRHRQAPAVNNWFMLLAAASHCGVINSGSCHPCLLLPPAGHAGRRSFWQELLAGGFSAAGSTPVQLR